MSLSKELLKISPVVANALRNRKPVVALQSTIISHGMPYPHNKQCAIEVENIIRDRGVEPATIAIMHGRIHIGLSHDEIEELAKGGSQARKVSRRDIPYVIAGGGLGSTTVAGTMVCSALAGIQIFVTGGLGGVHRGFEETMDVSADLRELGRTPVTVVSAGVKNILDIPRTLEYLETEGVPVVTYGSKYFPAFFAASSGIISPISIDKIEGIADMLVVHKKLGLQNGTLVAVPNQDTQDGQKIEKAIQQALKQANQQGIRGAATTPFLLKRVHQLTEGVSIRTNISLIKHNASVGANLALQFNKRLYGNSTVSFAQTTRPGASEGGKSNGKLIVIGGCARDYEISVNGKFQLHQSCRGKWKTSFGGVGRNISEVASRLGTQTVLITALSSDNPSEQLRNNIKSYGIQLKEVREENEKAPTFLGILDDAKESIISISDMDINKAITLTAIKDVFFAQQEKIGVNSKDIVVVDANIEETGQNLISILKYLNNLGYFIVYECKGRKSVNPVVNQAYKYISLIKMNQKEADLFLQTLHTHGQNIPKQDFYRWLSENIGRDTHNKSITDVNAIITRGSKEITLTASSGQYKDVPVKQSQCLKKTAGAGDTMTGTICSFLLRGEKIQNALAYAILASKMTVQSQSKVSIISEHLSYQNLQKQYENSRQKYVV